MDFTEEGVRTAFAEFLKDRMQACGMTVEVLAESSRKSERNIINYMNPSSNSAPKEISKEFYAAMKAVLGFTHEDFREYHRTQNLDQSQTSAVSNHFSNNTFNKSIIGANVVNVNEILPQNSDD